MGRPGLLSAVAGKKGSDGMTNKEIAERLREILNSFKELAAEAREAER